MNLPKVQTSREALLSEMAAYYKSLGDEEKDRLVFGGDPAQPALPPTLRERFAALLGRMWPTKNLLTRRGDA